MKKKLLLKILLFLILFSSLVLGFSPTTNTETTESLTENTNLEIIDIPETPVIIKSPESTIDRFHEINEGQYLTFTETQTSWGVTWSYITTDSQPPTPQFLGIPPGIDNLGVPAGATMHKVFGYLKTDNYSSNGTNLGCIANCNITATFVWTPDYCQAIGMNYTYYNTTSNTTKKYNYHFNLLKWRSDLPFPGVPIDTIIEKIRVNNVNRPVQFINFPTQAQISPNQLLQFDFSISDLDESCSPSEESRPAIVNFSGDPTVGNLTNRGGNKYRYSWTPTDLDIGIHQLQFNAIDSHNLTTQVNITINVSSSSNVNQLGEFQTIPSTIPNIISSTKKETSYETTNLDIPNNPTPLIMNPESTIDRFHEINESQLLTFTETQTSWGVTWSYITTDSQPPTPQFLGIPPGIDNLGVPQGATMPTVFGYLKTDNYSSNGTNLGCILNCNITSTFHWQTDYCDSIGMNYTFYNTTSNTTKKYNYHFNLLKWRSDLPFPGVPIDTIIEKIRVNNVNRNPVVALPSSYTIRPDQQLSLNIPLYDPDQIDCGQQEDILKNITLTSTHNEASLTQINNQTYRLNFNPKLNDLVCHNFTINATDNRSGSTQKTMQLNIIAPLEINNISNCPYAARVSKEPLSIRLTIPFYNISYQTCDSTNVNIGSTISYRSSKGVNGTLPIINNTVYFNWDPSSTDVGLNSFTFTLTNSINQSISKTATVQVFPRNYVGVLPTLTCAQRYTLD